MYARTPTGYPVQSPVQPSGGPPTPTFPPHQQPPVGPPPYGTGGPNTPADSGYYGSLPNMHHMSGPVPSPLSRGVSSNSDSVHVLIFLNTLQTPFTIGPFRPQFLFHNSMGARN